MAEKRQKKQAAKAFEKETFSMDKEVTGANHTENRQDNIFSTESQFHANEKPVSNLPRDANRGNDTKNVTSGHNVQKSEADAEKAFLKENSFMQEEQSEDFDTVSDSTMENEVHVRDTNQRSEEKGKYHKRRVQREHAHRERAKSEKPGQSDSGEFQTKDDTFTQGQTERFSDKRVQKAADRSEKNRRKLQKAKDKNPKKRQYEMKRVFDEQTGKAKYVVVPVEVEKPFKPDGLGKAAVHKLQTENMYFVHRKIAETEKDNSAVEGAHKTEQRAEDIYHYMKYHRKSKAQRKRDRLERLHKKQVTADMKLEYEKFISENPHLKGNSPKKQLQRQLQKQRIKREYAKARRVGAEAKTAKETFTKTANAATGIAKKLQEIATKNKTLIITVGIFALLLIMIMLALSSCGSMFTGTVTTTMASTYLSLPAEIDAADLSFTEKEMELQNKIDRIETDYPGYDEYNYNLGAIGHDPYTLISYLSAVHTEFTAAGIESEIQELFDAMYSLTTEEVEETRTRTVTKTGTRIVTNPDGTTRTEEYEYEEEEEYTVTILEVTLTAKDLNTKLGTDPEGDSFKLGATPELKVGDNSVLGNVFADKTFRAWNGNNSEAIVGNENNTSELYAETASLVPEITKANGYVKPQVYKDDQDLNNQLKAANEYCLSAITYTTPKGKEIALDGSTLITWLNKQDDGSYTKDESVFKEKLTAFVKELASQYNSIGATRTFTGKDGQSHTVSGGTYGFRVSTDSEVSALLKMINENKSENNRIPEHTGQLPSGENGGLGTTYLEINITKQHLWF